MPNMNSSGMNFIMRRANYFPAGALESKMILQENTRDLESK